MMSPERAGRSGNAQEKLLSVQAMDHPRDEGHVGSDGRGEDDARLRVPHEEGNEGCRRGNHEHGASRYRDTSGVGRAARRYSLA